MITVLKIAKKMGEGGRIWGVYSRFCVFPGEGTIDKGHVVPLVVAMDGVELFKQRRRTVKSTVPEPGLTLREHFQVAAAR